MIFDRLVCLLYIFQTIVGYNRGDKSDSVSQLRRPTIVKRDIKIDPEAEQKNINEILGDLDDDDCDDVPIISDFYTPVGLNEIKKEFPTVKIEGDSKHSPLAYPEDLNEFYGRPQPQLFILQVMLYSFHSAMWIECKVLHLQLPDSLPGEGPDEEPADSADLERSSSPDPVKNIERHIENIFRFH